LLVRKVSSASQCDVAACLRFDEIFIKDFIYKFTAESGGETI